MNLLIIKNDGIGDLISSSGIITELTGFYDKTDLLVCLESKPIAESIEGINDIYYVSRNSLSYKSYPLKFGLFIKKEYEDIDKYTIEKLKQTSYDVTIILRRFIGQSTFIIANEIISNKIIYMWQYTTNLSILNAKKLTKHHILSSLDNSSILSEQEYYSKILKKEYTDSTFDFTPRLTFVKDFVKHCPNTLGIVISGASVKIEAKVWINIIERLKYNNILIFGGSNEKNLGKLIVRSVVSKKINDLTGKLSFKDSINYIQQCELIIGNDTGFSHFVSLYNKNIIIILGGGTFRRFFPWKYGVKQKIIYYGMNCYDCEWNCYRKEKQECIKKLNRFDLITNLEELINNNLDSLNISNTKKYFSVLDENIKSFSDNSIKRSNDMTIIIVKSKLIVKRIKKSLKNRIYKILLVFKPK